MTAAVMDLPVVRTEVELAAELLWLLCASRVVPADGAWLENVCHLVGIEVNEVREAETRVADVRRFVPPRREAASEPGRSARRPPAPRALRRPATRTRPVQDDKLWCPRHTDGQGAWLAAESFGLRADRPGKRKPWCRECTTAYAAGKYLSRATVEMLQAGGVLVSELPADSPLLARPCPRCNEPFLPTDRVVMGDPMVLHKCCGDEDGRT